MPSLRVSIAAAFALVLAGCGPFFLEAEIAEACYTVSQKVPGVPLETDRAISLRLPLEYALDAAVTDRSTVELLSLELVASGIDDLGFLDALELRTPSAPSNPACGLGTAAVDPCAAAGIALVRYQRSGEVGSRLELPAEAPVDLTDHLSRGKVRLEAVAAGRLPAEDWALDATACFRVASELIP